MARLRYIGIHTGGVDVPDAGIWDAVPGAEFDIHDEIAFGRAAVIEARGDAGDVIVDPGTTGLIATGNWEEVGKKKPAGPPLPPEDN